MFEDADIISAYSDKDALQDGSLIDVSSLGAGVQGKLVNRVTRGAADHCHELSSDTLALAVASVQHAAPDWFYALPCGLWLVENDADGFTLLCPDEY